VSPTFGGSGSGGAELLKSLAGHLKPFVENDRERYEPSLPEFPGLLTESGDNGQSTAAGTK
jgi:hypothetical protein